jgi:hypothetical protein
VRTWAWRGLIVAGAAAICLCGAVSFGLTRADAATLRDFDAAVARWQHDPDFRAVTREYVILGVRAMQVHLCGVPARIVILKFRSLPGLPASLAVNPTSESHYRDFSRGELSAYLHLCDEQGVENAVPMIENLLAQPAPPTDAQLADFLRCFKMPVPIATDAGAVRSVRAVLDDIRASTPLAIHARVGQPIARYTARMTGRDANHLAFDEQHRAMAQLDGWLRSEDPQLWRTKQVSDLLAGIWAQGYGQIYCDGIEWLFRIQRYARVGLFALLVGAALVWKVHDDNRCRAAISSKAHGSAVGRSQESTPNNASIPPTLNPRNRTGS